MRKLLVLFCAVLALSSCKTSFLQYYDVESKVEEKNSQYQVENDECSVVFNFWGELGSASFVFHNKTDHNLFIPLRKSSFVFNGISRSMYSNVKETVVMTKFSTKTFESEPVICVAPNSSVVVYDKTLVDRAYLFCENHKDYPKRSYGENFDEYTSPIKFGYYIDYSWELDCERTKTISADFYVSRIENMKSKYATHKESLKNCNTYTEETYRMIDGNSPKRFFIKSHRSGSLGNKIGLTGFDLY